MTVFKRNPKNGRKCVDGQPGVWYYYFTVDGRRYRGAIPSATNKKQALIAEAAARSEVFNNKYGHKGGQAIFSDFVWDEETQTSEYLEWVKRNRPKSLPMHRTYAPVIAEFFKGKRFCDIMPKLVEQYRDHRLAQPSARDGGPRSGNSVCRELAILSSIFALAIKRDYYEGRNPVSSDKVDWPHEKKTKTRRTRTFTDEEEDLIVSRMSGKYERLRAPFLVAMSLGCRRGEMFDLTWNDISFEKRQVHFREEVTKTGEERLTSLIEPAYSELMALKNRNVTEPTIFGIRKQNGSRLLRELFDTLIAEGLLTGYISGWHVCRHTQITRGFEAGRRPDVVRDETGHKDLKMTFYYAHAGDEDRLRDAQKLERRSKKHLTVSIEAQDGKNG